MFDVFVDVDDEIVNDVAVAVSDAITDAVDEIVDISAIVSGRSYGSDSDVKIIRHNHMEYARNYRPADYVSFRYSRFDRVEHCVPVENPTMAMFRRYQNLIDELATSDVSHGKKRQVCRAIMNQFQQKLQSGNIRYRQLWRQINTHGM